MAGSAAVLWGISGTAAQVLFSRYSIDAGWLVSVRMLAAGLLLLGFAVLRSGVRDTIGILTVQRDARDVIVLGVFGLWGVQYPYLESIAQGNAATATLLQYLGPVFLTLFVAMRARQRLGPSRFVAVVFAFLGTALLVTNGHWNTLSVSSGALFWGLLSGVTLAFYTVFPGALLKRYKAPVVIGWSMLVGGVVDSFVRAPWTFRGEVTVFSLALILFVVLGGTLIPFFLYLASLRFISTTRASLLTCIEPLSAAIVAVAVLGVRLGGVAELGGVCIILTVIVLSLRST